MKTPQFILLIKRFAIRYKGHIALNILCNVLATLFSIFSFAVLIPILQILFKTEQTVYEFQPWSFDSIKNNAYYFVQQYIEQNGGISTLLLLSVVLIFMTLLKTGTTYLASYFIIPMRTGLVRDIRRDMYAKIVDLNLGFYDKQKKGDIMARMLSDVGEVEASIMSSIELLSKNPIMIIFYLGVMLMLSWELTLFVLLVLPIAGFLMGRIGRSLKRKSVIGQEQQGSLTSIIEETLNGLRIIKAFNAEEHVCNRFGELNNQLRKTTNKINRRYMLAHPMSEFLGTLMIAIVLYFGGSLILNEQSTLNAGEFIYYLVIFYSIINPAKELSKAMYSIEKGKASLARIDMVLMANNPLKVVDNPVKAEPFEKEISFKDVWFKYDEEWILKGISLDIKKGQTIALVGASGSGKSTMVDLLPRFYDVQKGEITIDGTDIRHFTLHDLRGYMGNVNQDPILFNDTIYNNIKFGTDNATEEDIINAAKIANAHNFIMETEDGYQTNIGDHGGRLSGGQRQRLSIARAILKNPSILILDEATSALDTESEKLVQAALEELMKNRTTIVIAHRLSTIKKADLICVLEKGEIVEKGTHEELIQKGGLYNKLYSMQK